MQKKKESSVDGQMTLFELEKHKKEIIPSEPIWERPELYMNTPDASTELPEENQAKKRHKKKQTSTKENASKDSGKSNVEEEPNGNSRNSSEPKKLKKSELKEYSKNVLEEYDVIRIGGIMRCCRISSTEAQQVMTYMEGEGMTVNHKKPKSGKKWEAKS